MQKAKRATVSRSERVSDRKSVRPWRIRVMIGTVNGKPHMLPLQKNAYYSSRENALRAVIRDDKGLRFSPDDKGPRYQVFHFGIQESKLRLLTQHDANQQLTPPLRSKR